MNLYRISEEQFSRDLSGEGARLYGGRWNPKGIPMIYTAESVALAALEVLIRLSTSKRYFRVRYEIDDAASVETVSLDELPSSWQSPYPNRELMEIGRRWAVEQRSLLLRVPSAIVCGEGWNYLINPLHPAFPAVTIGDVTPFCYDARFSRKQG